LVYPWSLQTLAADLHLDCQGCSSDEALARGTAATESAKGVRRVISYDITGRPVEFADEESETAAGRSVFAEAWEGLRSAKREMTEKLRFSSGRVRESLADGKRSLDEYRLRKQELRAQAAARAEESKREREAQRQALEAERSRRQRELAQREAETVVLRERLQVEKRQSTQEAIRRTRADEDVRPYIETALVDREAAPLPQPYRYRRDRDLQKAAVAATVLALLAILGLGAYRNRLMSPPLSKRDVVRTQEVSKPIPFSAATTPMQPRATEPVKLSPDQRVSLPQTDAAVAPTRAPVIVRKRPVRRARVDESDFVGEDRVIVHRLRPSGTAQARSNVGAGPKRISDLD
jgi:hypothetical protein